MVRFMIAGPYGPQTQGKIGLLIDYHKWEKIATVLYEGKVHRVAADRVTKAGKKDMDANNENSFNYSAFISLD